MYVSLLLGHYIQMSKANRPARAVLRDKLTALHRSTQLAGFDISALSKVQLIGGDATRTGLGLSTSAYVMLTRCVTHSKQQYSYLYSHNLIFA